MTRNALREIYYKRKTEASGSSPRARLRLTRDFDADSEITELEQHLWELKQYILKWSTQDIEKSQKDSDEERPP